MSLVAFNKKKQPMEVVVVWAVFFMAEHWFGKLLSAVNSSEVVSVHSKLQKEAKKLKHLEEFFSLNSGYFSDPG